MPVPAVPRLSPGAAEALADNPDFSDVVLALANAPDEPAAAASGPFAPRVLRAVARMRRLARVRAAVLWTAAAAAAAAVVVAAMPPAVTPAAVPGTGPEVAALLAAQRPDGSWIPARGGEALAPAATGLAVLRLASSGDPAASGALERAAAWLRTAQNADGSFGGGVSAGLSAPNLALPAAALLRLYGSGDWPELFTPVDGAVSAVRARLASSAAEPREGDLWLAAVLSIADGLDWPDSASGDLRRALRRFAASGDPRFDSVSGAASFAGKNAALVNALEKAVL